MASSYFLLWAYSKVNMAKKDDGSLITLTWCRHWYFRISQVQKLPSWPTEANCWLLGWMESPVTASVWPTLWWTNLPELRSKKRMLRSSCPEMTSDCVGCDRTLVNKEVVKQKITYWPVPPTNYAIYRTSKGIFFCLCHGQTLPSAMS